MQLSKETIKILKNFSTINHSLYFLEGKTQKTISQSKSIYAQAEIEEELPMSFGIYDLGQFLNVLDLFNQDPDIDFQEKMCVISEGRRKVNYKYCAPKIIQKPPEKSLKLPSEEEQFELTGDILDKVLKSTNLLDLQHICFQGDNGNLFVNGIRFNDSNKEIVYSNQIGETDAEFDFVLSLENLKVIPGDYLVKLSKKGLCKFTSKNFDLFYFMPFEEKSKYVGRKSERED